MKNIYIIMYCMASYKFTEEVDNTIKDFCFKNYTTVTEIFKTICKWWYFTYYKIKQRWVISTRITKKLKDLWIDFKNLEKSW